MKNDTTSWAVVGVLATSLWACGGDDGVGFGAGVAGGGAAGRPAAEPGEAGGAGGGGKAPSAGASGKGGITGKGGSSGKGGAMAGSSSGLGGAAGNAGTPGNGQSGVAGMLGDAGAGGGGGPTEIGGFGGAGTGGGAGDPSMAGAGGSVHEPPGGGSGGAEAVGGGGTGGSGAAGSGGTGGSGAAGGGGTGGSGPVGAGGGTAMPLGDEAKLAGYDAFGVIQLVATKGEIIALSASSVDSRNLSFVPLLGGQRIVFATTAGGFSLLRIDGNAGDDRYLVDRGLSGTRVYGAEGQLLAKPSLSGIERAVFVGAGPGALVCGNDRDAFHPNGATTCVDGGGEAYYSYATYFLGGSGGFVRLIEGGARQIVNPLSDIQRPENELLVGARQVVFGAAGYVAVRACAECGFPSGQEALEWGTLPAAFPKGQLARQRIVGVTKGETPALHVAAHHVVHFAPPAEEAPPGGTLTVFDRETGYPIESLSGVAAWAANGTHVVYARNGSLYRRALP